MRIADDGYALTNFRLGFRTKDGLNIYAWVRNAFDTKYSDQLNFGPNNTELTRQSAHLGRHGAFDF